MPTPFRPNSAPAIGVGTWAWGNQLLWGYRPEQDRQLQATFQRAVDLGLCFFDTADSYGTGRFNGRSEQLLGQFCAALASASRDRLCVATKLAPFPWRLGRAGYRRAFEASRRRLQGKLDRVQLHWSTARYAPWQEGPLLEGLADLVEQGAVAELGVSNMGPQRLRQMQARLADRGLRLASLQLQMSLLAPAPIASEGVLAVCRELGIAVIAYSPLALGVLGVAPNSPAPLPSGPRGALFRRLLESSLPLRQALAVIAAQRNSEPAAVALNWCRAHGAMPIPGLRTPLQAERAAAALAWELGEEERLELDRLALAQSRRMPANPFQSA
ncbi:MAG: aldo/keto reductase [Prochlorococcaceae cyanobacterium]